MAQRPLQYLTILLLTIPALGILNSASAQTDTTRPYVTPIDRYLVLYPSYITAGSYTGDYDIMAQTFSTDGTLEWSPLQPRPVCSQRYRELAPVALPDSQGGAFLAYVAEQTDNQGNVDRDILMRHIDSQGRDLWGDSSGHVVPIAQSKYSEQNPRLVLASDGSIMVFYEVHYGLPGSGGDVDVAAIKISREGTKMWERGVWIANSKRREHLSGAVTDGLGGGIAVVEISTSDSAKTLTSDIIAVHANATGEIGWKPGESTVVAGSRHLERNAAVVGDGFGGAYIAYELEYTSGERTGDVDILAQHISSLGIREWTNEEEPPIVSSNDKAREEAPSIALDSNGIIVAFQIEAVRDRKPVFLIGAQHMDSRGKLVWYEGKKPKLISVPKRVVEHPQAVTDTSGGVFVVFEARDTVTNDRDIYAQKLGNEGDLLWEDGEDPLPVFKTSDIERDATPVADGFGGLLIAADRESTSGESAGASNIVVQRIAADGTFPWEAFHSPLQLTATKNRDGKPVLVKSLRP